MPKPCVGIVHPGEMGSFVAASVLKSGNDVRWASEGRSAQTRDRAVKINLMDTGSLEELCQTCSIIISVCPPHAAEEVAGLVLNAGFDGLYLDANAISPDRVQRIGKNMLTAGIQFVDGGIIGGPSWGGGTTWLYLSGDRAADAAACFSVGSLRAVVIGKAIGKASALKMCYAAHSKGTTALQCAVLAAAEAHGVRRELQQQWSTGDSDLTEKVFKKVRGASVKAWRFSGEMEEIAHTFDRAGIPDGFHNAAASIFRRISGFKDAQAPPPIEDVLAMFLKKHLKKTES